MKQKILVCSDNNKVLENLISILEKYKYKIDLAHSYQVLFDLMEKQRKKVQDYSLVITDLHVNKENGKQYFDDIISKAEDSKIIAIYSHSGYTVEWIDEISKDAKNVLFLKKPFDDLEFLQMVRHCLDKVEETPVSSSCCDESVISDRISFSNKKLLENIAHEVRTPMSGIIGIAGVLEQTNLGDVQKHYVKSIVQSAESLLNIITDLIDFEEVKDQKIELNNQDFCFTDLIEGCINLVCTQSKFKEIDINISISDKVPTFISSDESKLRKVIWNILTNSVKYTNYGNVTVFCDYESTKKGNNLIITFKDTGIGIDEESQKNLFTKFTDTQTAYRSGGSGIGLSITKHILDAFGGSIEVHSEVDVGSVFEIKVPVDTVSDKTLQLEFGSFTPLNERKGIMICSNKFTAQAVMAQFAKQNCTLDLSSTIRKGRTKIQHAQEELHWCLIDESVVNEDSLALLKNLVLACKQNGIRIMFLTKKDDLIERLAKIGIHNVLKKPCRERDIRHKLSYHSDTQKSSSLAPSLIPVEKISKQKDIVVLLAEDNEINQMVVSEILKRNGIKVDVAKHGKIAVDKAAMAEYDLVLMDLQMPIMNGIEATKKIRVDNKEIPVIGMTSNSASGLENECKLAGMNDYITKPVVESKLISLIKDLT